MIHPTALLRNDSIYTRPFSAPIPENTQLDCGIKLLPCLNKCCNLDKLAKPSVFIGLLSAVAFLQGITLEYFRDTSIYWRQHYQISPDNAEWIIYTNEFLVGLFALVLAYWGNRVHRPKWIGALTTYHAFASLLLIIPELHKNDNNVTQAENLCVQPPTEKDYIGIAVLGFFQIFASTAYISLITHGITYLDDNIMTNHAPTYIGIVLACKEFGKQAAIHAVDLLILIDKDKIFVSPVWITIGIVTLLIGSCIAMFPHALPQALIERLSASLIDLASGHEHIPKRPQYDGFFKTVFRLIKNKYFIINIIATVLVQSAIINFNMFEKFYNQTKFFISKKNEEEKIISLLSQPLVAIALIVTGLLLSKSKFTPKTLVKWNIFVTVVVIIVFASTAFLPCDPESLEDDTFDTSCSCERQFQPICVNNARTYYSPCIAGCETSITNEIKRKNPNITYSKCGKNKLMPGREGACNEATDCYYKWLVAQANRVFSTAFLASTLLTNIMINMRCVHRNDKATALGLEATLLGLVPYLPVKSSYEAIADAMCLNRDKVHKLCFQYSQGFGLFISLSTITLFLLSLFLSILLLFIKQNNGDNSDDDDDDNNDNESEMQEMQDVTTRPS